MVKPEKLFSSLAKKKLTFYSGVPCSIFKDLIICLNQNSKVQHIRATSEGEAIGLAAGYYLATKKIPIVYMQNSGFGNAVNPLTSLADREVYSLPMLLFISWRGEPGVKDEPQHKKMGRIMLALLDVLEIPYLILNPNRIEKQIDSLVKKAKEEQRPVALIFKEGQIAKLEGSAGVEETGFTREEALSVMLSKIGRGIVVSTTGKTSREIFEIRKNRRQGHEQDFLMVGSMGCALSTGLAIKLNTPKKVFVVDGDGAVLMKMGTLTTVGSYAPKKFIHIVIDNGAYESTGGQCTSSTVVDWKKLFQSAGYRDVIAVNNKSKLRKINFAKLRSPAAIVVKVISGSRKDLGRPTTTPTQNRDAFMAFVK